ncbi:Cholesterol dehydrogenase [Actinokineospora sp. UTMC 2448]|nr:Cholesterol dehydrogenase [Actinokineospora sp. UTMC 2448]
MVMKVLVTGSAGVLGASLAASLSASGHEVHGVDVRAAAVPEAAHHVADVRDTATLRGLAAGMDAVIHTASALPSYPADQIRSVVVDGTRSVLDAAHRAGVPRVVHISSTAVYGLPRLVPTPEDYPQVPVDTYSAAKVDAEVVAREYRAKGMCLSVIRPKTFLGPGRMGLFAMLFEWAREGRNFPVLGRGDVRIQMLALEDLVEVIGTVLRAEPDIANDTYNVGAAEFATLREDFQTVLDAAGHGKRVVSLPIGPALAMLRGLERAKLSPVYGRLLSKLKADSYVSIDKAAARLGFAPKFSNRDAILSTYRWWTEQPPATGSGTSSREPWRQGALSLVKALF